MQASGLVQLDISNTLTMDYGTGSPSTGNDYGIRVGDVNTTAATTCASWSRTAAYLTNSMADVQGDVNCSFINQLDSKIDDGMPNTGKLNGAGYYNCVVGSATTCGAQYLTTGTGLIVYDLKGF